MKLRVQHMSEKQVLKWFLGKSDHEQKQIANWSLGIKPERMDNESADDYLDRRRASKVLSKFIHLNEANNIHRDEQTQRTD